MGDHWRAENHWRAEIAPSGDLNREEPVRQDPNLTTLTPPFDLAQPKRILLRALKM